jgi:SAM-dependent methyltransferase
MDATDLRSLLHRLAGEYPEGLRGAQHQDVERIAFHIELVVRRKGTDCALVDIGGGIGLFTVGCAALGLRSTLVDDFADAINLDHGETVFDVHRRYGVTVVARDAIAGDLYFDPGSIDVVTMFDSMEHWHHSPKKLFRMLANALRPQGVFIIGGPNCVNLRKRMSVPFGVGKWSSIRDWYEPEVFRGHVREPDVEDLLYIARDLDLGEIEILGRNWLGYRSRHRWVRTLTKLADHGLRYIPSLCSDIYLVGRKGAGAKATAAADGQSDKVA